MAANNPDISTSVDDSIDSSIADNIATIIKSANDSSVDIKTALAQISAQETITMLINDEEVEMDLIKFIEHILLETRGLYEYVSLLHLLEKCQAQDLPIAIENQAQVISQITEKQASFPLGPHPNKYLTPEIMQMLLHTLQQDGIVVKQDGKIVTDMKVEGMDVTKMYIGPEEDKPYCMAYIIVDMAIEPSESYLYKLYQHYNLPWQNEIVHVYNIMFCHIISKYCSSMDSM